MPAKRSLASILAESIFPSETEAEYQRQVIAWRFVMAFEADNERFNKKRFFEAAKIPFQES